MALLDRLRVEIKKQMASYAVSPRHWTVSHIYENNDQIELIALEIASPGTVFSRSGPQRLLAFADLKNMPQRMKFDTNEKVVTEIQGQIFTKKNVILGYPGNFLIDALTSSQP